ncbi:hypothetical protein SNE40_011461 [Patella caerulea]|uniref:Splicing factor 4 n=1 Tax=Patella caerulea TaxID=87958 RepID=A0AAN8JMR3_PATCE
MSFRGRQSWNPGRGGASNQKSVSQQVIDQEKLIEEKKRQIQEKLAAATQRQNVTEQSNTASVPSNPMVGKLPGLKKTSFAMINQSQPNSRKKLLEQAIRKSQQPSGSMTSSLKPKPVKFELGNRSNLSKPEEFDDDGSESGSKAVYSQQTSASVNTNSYPRQQDISSNFPGNDYNLHRNEYGTVSKVKREQTSNTYGSSINAYGSQSSVNKYSSSNVNAYGSQPSVNKYSSNVNEYGSSSVNEYGSSAYGSLNEYGSGAYGSLNEYGSATHQRQANEYASIRSDHSNSLSSVKQIKSEDEYDPSAPTEDTPEKGESKQKLQISIQSKSSSSNIQKRPTVSQNLSSVFDQDFKIKSEVDADLKSTIDELVATMVKGGILMIQKVMTEYKDNPKYWFLYKEDSEAHKYFCLKMQTAPPKRDGNEADVEENDESQQKRAKRKRKSRWGSDEPAAVKPIIPVPTGAGIVTNIQLGGLSTVQKPPVHHYPTVQDFARKMVGSDNISPEQMQQIREQKELNMMYELIIAQKKAKEAAVMAEVPGIKVKPKYEYDSDEEVEGGTWEHRQRASEMNATKEWADQLTDTNRGKHFIGDFLPPQELEKFMETYRALKEGRTPDYSDYKEFKITCENIGYQMLQKLGWKEGEGLGPESQGITQPVNKGNTSVDNMGLGIEKQANLNQDDDEFDAYRKRMMLAYKFRPNPLNNPRRPYY